MKVNVLKLLNGLSDRGVLSLNFADAKLLEECISLLNGEYANAVGANAVGANVDVLINSKLGVVNAGIESPPASLPLKKRGRPRKEKSVVSSTSDRGDDLIASLVAEAQRSKQNKDSDNGVLVPEQVDIEEAITVKKMEYDGETYLISGTNVIFSFSDHEEIGIFKDGRIILN
jgi:hypothetical protein